MAKPLLKINQLTKHYGQGPVLNEIDFSVNEGEVIVIVGPSGCGKSTLLRCINALEPIQSGNIILEDQDLSSMPLTQLRQRIGMVFQSYELFPTMTVLENITLAPVKVSNRNKKEVIEEATHFLKRVGLEDKANVYPNQLSGGQKQRVAIVRALMMHPEILLLDEITAALDPEMVREVLEVVLQLADEGKTMLIVTHEMEFAKAVADRILFIDQGHIVEDSSPEQFFTEPKTPRAKQFLHTFTYSRKHKGEKTYENKKSI